MASEDQGLDVGRPGGPLERSLTLTSRIAAGATVLLGLMVLLGWHIGSRTLIQVLPTFVPMQYNTALGFVFTGLALLLTLHGRPRAASFAGGLLLLIGGLTLVEYAAGLNLGIDELFMKHDITVATSHPGRMAPNTALCFTLVGLAVVSRPGRSAVLQVVLGSLAFALATVALSGYFMRLETAYGWGKLTRMAVHTSIGFVLASIGLLGLAWRRDLRREAFIPRWMPVLAFTVVLTATLCFWQALAAERTRLEQRYEDLEFLSALGTALLIVGFLLAVAVAAAAWLAQRANLRSRQAMRANRALEDSRERTLTELLESAPDAMIIADGEGRIRRCNARVCEIFGYDREELTSMSVSGLVPKPFRERHAAHLADYFADPKAREMGSNLELLGTRKDGTEFPIEIGLSPFNDPEGLLAVAAIRDISERKRVEAELRFKEQRFRTLVANLPETIYRCLHDDSWTMLFISDDVEVLTGYPASDFVDNAVRTFGSVIHDEDRAEVARAVEAAVQAGTPWHVEYRIIRAEGSVRWVSERGRAVFDTTGRVDYLDGVITDITRRKEMESEIRLAREQAETANRAKSEFLSHMSHELRTPLNGVLGYAQILQRDPGMTASQRESLDAIVSCGAHLLSLINDVLDLSKIEAGRVEIDAAPTDLNKVLKSVGDVVEQRAQAAGLSFDSEVSPEVPRGIVTDEAKLRQILINLLGNAVKFTQVGGVSLHVSEARNSRLRFEVVDTGVGMSEAELSDIFDPFKQVEAGKAAGGTGLGLAITRRLVEALGGGIDVTSEKGKGSKFTVELPVVEAPTEDLESLEAAGALDYGAEVLAPGQTCTVLVADDRKTNRDILERMLSAAGIVSLIADDGDTALELLRAHDEIDLVLMDIRMPRLNGIDALRQIRADERLKSTKVVAVTASVFPEFRKKALEEGFDGFLGKPFRTEELMAEVKRHVDVVFLEEAPEPEDKPEAGKTSLPTELAARTAAEIREALELGNVTALTRIASNLDSTPGAAGWGQRIGDLAHAFDFAGLERLAAELTSGPGEQSS